MHIDYTWPNATCCCMIASEYIGGAAPPTHSACRLPPGPERLVVAGVDCLVLCQALTSATLVLVMVSMQAVPLVWACTDGMRVLGAELAIPRPSRYAVAKRWAELMLPGAGAVTYLGGRATSGAQIYVAPTAYLPPQGAVATTPASRRKLQAAGRRMAWLSVAAMAGTATFELLSHAAFACAGLRGDTGALPLSALPGSDAAFRFGVTSVRSLVQAPADLPISPTRLDSVLARCFQQGRYLADLLTSDGSVDCDYLAEWAEQIVPPPLSEIPHGILDRLPSFDTPRYDGIALPAIPAPRKLDWLQRMPQQPPMPREHCIRSPEQLMPHWRWRAVQRWLMIMLADLVCVRDLGTSCERFRPRVLVMGQDALFPEYRNRIYDFRNSPSQCATYLDNHAPIEHTLKVDYFQRRLADYPNQRILSFIVHGVRPLADVELQTVLVPHLMSLANGFQSVVDELKRMSSPELGWYSMHPPLPVLANLWSWGGHTTTQTREPCAQM